jgi:hypothetical protein
MFDLISSNVIIGAVDLLRFFRQEDALCGRCNNAVLSEQENGYESLNNLNGKGTESPESLHCLSCGS